MLLPIRTDSPLKQTPWINWFLIAANVVIYVLQQNMPWLNRYCLNPANPTLFTFISYAFLHGGILHLLGNMLFLYIFGNNVNDRLGNFGYLGFYLAGAVFAGVGYSFVELHVMGHAYRVLGASGAIAAVIGAYLVLFPRSHVTIIYLIFFIGAIDIPSVWFVAFFFGYDLLFSASQDGVAHMAHVSGTLFGFAVCIALLALSLLPRDQFDIVALVQRWNRRRKYRGVVAKGYDPFAYKHEALPGPADPTKERVSELRGKISEAIGQHKHAEAAEHFLAMKKLDPTQVLSRQAQLDVANQLASQQRYAEAAEAYEQFLASYKKFEQIEQVELMLGLIYARYLERYDRAKEYLLRALARLHGERQIELAKSELKRIEPMSANAEQ